MSTPKGSAVEFSGGYNLLMLRAEEGNIDDVKKIMADKKNIDLNATNKNGYTALALSVKAGHHGLTSYFIHTGADVNIKNNAGQSPLFLACWNNFESIVKLLIENRAEINCTDQRQWTPLMIASYHGHKEVVKALLDYKADYDVQDCFGKKAIDRAKDPSVVKLLQKAEARINSLAKTADLTSSASANRNTYTSRSPQHATHQSFSANTTKGNLKKSSSKGNLSSRDGKRLASPPRDRDSTIQQPSPFYVTDSIVTPSSANKMLNLTASTRVPRGTNESRRQLSVSIGSAKKDKFGLTIQSPGASKLNGSSMNMTQGSLSRGRSPSPTQKRNIFKEDLQQLITEQLGFYTKKMQLLMLQKVAYEVPVQVSSYEHKIKSEINTLLNFRVNHIAKNLQTYFNLKLKFCLNKLGYDTNALELRPFIESDDSFELGLGFLDTGKQEGDMMIPDTKDLKAMENEIKHLESSIYSHKITVPAEQTSGNEKSGRACNHSHSQSKNGRERTPERACEHSAYHHHHLIKTELTEYLTDEMKTSTKSMIEYSNNKFNETIRENNHAFQSKVVQDLNSVLDSLEEKFKNKFEEIIHYKTMQLVEKLGHQPKQGLLSPYKKAPMSPTSNKKSDHIKLSPSPTRISTQKMKINNEIDQMQDDINFKTTMKSSISQFDPYTSGPEPETDYFNEGSFTSNPPKRGSKPSLSVGGGGARSKIEQLKSSLTFMDEEDSHRLPKSPRDLNSVSGFNTSGLYHDSNEKGKGAMIEDELMNSVISRDNNQQKGPTATQSEKSLNANKLEELKMFYKNKVINKSEDKSVKFQTKGADIAKKMNSSGSLLSSATKSTMPPY
jgi:hypothetical protein